ncbi:MAG: hypothetical protein KF730_13455 [Sphingomonas sp.]|uniref:hypothetical protein n=1 Tax=Sphingomonas sp. TaxID=28214 RepID=UPI0025D034AA|nr:hypothetical protein [Sphingomonas sp.]MBX3565570.1 hypothetical protein [Sphingomonas sp.]
MIRSSKKRCARLPLAAAAVLAALVATPLHAQTSAPAGTRASAKPAGIKCHSVSVNQSPTGDANWFKTTTKEDWSGACVDGMARGFGRLSRAVDSSGAIGTSHTTAVMEGTIASGAPVGMWCNLTLISDNENVIDGKSVKSRLDMPRPCTIIYPAGRQHKFGWRHNPDGSWSVIEIASVGLRTPLTVSADTMDKMVARVVQDPKAFPDFGFTTGLLDGLLPGGAATSLGDMSKPIDLAGKRIALVLSSRTVTELARWGQQRDAFVKSKGYGKKFGSAGFDMVGQRYDESLAGHIAATDPAGFVPSVIAVLRKELGDKTSIVAADDLGVLTGGQADYAIVVDWSFEGGLPSPTQIEKTPVCDLVRGPAACTPLFEDHWVALVVDPKIRVAAFVTANIGGVKKYAQDTAYSSFVRDISWHLWRQTGDSNMARIVSQLGGRLQ